MAEIVVPISSQNTYRHETVDTCQQERERLDSRGTLERCASAERQLF